MASKNIIEINGKTYDAHTGKPLSSNKRAATVRVKPRPAKAQRSVDGISHNAKRQSPVEKKPVNTQSTNATSAKKVRNKAPHVTPKAQRAKTLHRRGLLVPSFEFAGVTTPQISTNGDISKRLERAMKVHKSSVVQRFSNNRSVPKDTTETENKTPQTTAVKTPKKAEVIFEKKGQSSSPIAKSKSSTKKRRSYRKHVSITGYATTALATIALAAYITYLHVPAVSIKVAASQAGFSATLPSYKPAGYSFAGPATYAPGLVLLNFASSDNSKSFNLAQRPTTWDSAALKHEMEQRGEVYTRQDSGLTIYFGDSKASWVNAGKLYSVDTKNSQLDISEVARLATSM